MNKLWVFAVCFGLSNCQLASFYRYRAATAEESIAQHSFKKEIPFRQENGWLVVEVFMDGKPQNFVFDTGASTILDAGFAKTIRCKRIGSQNHTDTWGKKRKTRLVKLDEITLGGIVFSPVVAGVADLERLRAISCVDFVGIFGANMMNKAVWQIDYRRSIITLTDSADSLENGAGLRFHDFYAEGRGTPKISLRSMGNYWCEADLDTGSNGGIELPMGLEKHLPSSSRFIKKTGLSQGLFTDGVAISKTAIVPELSLCQGFGAKNVATTFSAGLPYAIIGNRFLRDYQVTIDWKRHKIAFSDFAPMAENGFAGFGFAPTLADGKLIVASITENAPAAGAGMNLGDQILEIDGVDFRAADRMGYCRLLADQIGGGKPEISIKTKRGEQESELKLTKIDLWGTNQDFKK